MRGAAMARARSQELTVRIIADVHETKSGIPAALESLGAQVSIAPLPGGDYLLGADTIAERKRVRDLHAAILKGRFWAQIAKLRGAGSFPYLLIEGPNLDDGPLHPNAVRGACLAVIDQGVALLRSTGREDSARWLYRLAVRSQRLEPPPDRPLYSQRPAARSERETAEAMLAAIPGVSTVTARALLAEFGTVAGVLAAGQEGWLRVPGVGHVRAEALAAALTLSWAEENAHFEEPASP